MSQIEDKLAALGLTLSNPPSPAASYVPFVFIRNVIITSGQLPMIDGQLKYGGKVGQDLDLATAQEAAHLCALNTLSVLKAAVSGNLNRVVRCLRLGGFVNATPDFTDHSKVMNGASDLMIAVMGEQGRHARSAIGCGSLPLGAAVELEALFEIE